MPAERPPDGWDEKVYASGRPGRGHQPFCGRGWAGEAGRRRKLFALHDPGGERRLLFGVGEGPAEAVAEAKENTDNNYPPSVAPPVLTSARTAALTGSGMFGQAATISAGSGFISITPPI